jgi:hypothetical protein
MAELSKPALAFLAGATLIGTIGIGKAAVDASYSKVVYPKHKDTALDESVRLVGTLVGIAITLVQLPKAWEEAQKFLTDFVP